MPAHPVDSGANPGRFGIAGGKARLKMAAAFEHEARDIAAGRTERGLHCLGLRDQVREVVVAIARN